MSDIEPQTRREYAWTAHPAAERPASAVLAGGVILAMAAAIWFSFDSIAWGAVSLLVLIAALNRFFFPSRYSIDAEGIAANHLLVRKQAQWRYLRRFVHDDRGGFLSTRAQPSRLDAFRGMHVLFGTCRDEVVASINAAMKRHNAVTDAASCDQQVAASPTTGKAAA